MEREREERRERENLYGTHYLTGVTLHLVCTGKWSPIFLLSCPVKNTKNSLIVHIGQLENLHRNVIAIVIDRIQLIQVLICNRYYVLEYDIE